MGTSNCCAYERKNVEEKYFNNQAQSNYKTETPNILKKDKAYFSNLNNQKTIDSIIKIQQNYKSSNSRKLMNNILIDERNNVLNNIIQKKISDTSFIQNLECEKFYQSLLNSNKIIPFPNLPFFSKINYTYLKYSFPIEEYIQYSPTQIYKGSYNIKGNFNGYGTIYEINKKEKTNRKIEGFFLDGILDNEGRIFTSNSEYYGGKFKKNELNGEGKFVKNEIEYIGTFLNGLQNGKGKEIYNDNSTFEGMFLNGNKINGKFIWKDGNLYKGDILNDLFHGFGIYEWDKNKKYEGQWKYGKMNGKGKIYYSDGSIYEGDFVDNLRCGYGKYIWDKNKYYEGQWNNNFQNGKGIYYKNGYVTKGLWVDGKIISGHNKKINKRKGNDNEKEHSITNRTINSINGVININNNANLENEKEE